MSTAKSKARAKLPGSIHQQKNGRWYWRIKLPGKDNYEVMALRPPGAQYATRDESVAVEIAKQILETHNRKINRQAAGYAGTISELVTRYEAYATAYYKESNEVVNVKRAMSHLTGFAGQELAEDFGPLKLKALREEMIQEMKTRPDGTEVPRLCRKEVNRRIGIIKRAFKWAASEELVPQSVYLSLTTVDGLRRGRSEARETEPVKPVPIKFVEITAEFASPTVRAMIELQLLTGMRSGELVIMRPMDIDTTGHTWEYRPFKHKTEHHGYERIVAIGPKGQEILKPFLRRKLDAYCFSPREAAAAQWNVTGEKAESSTAHLSECYDRHSYRHAIEHAIKAARKAGKKVPDWTPHQLRHTAGTIIRKEYDLETARAVLGHRSAQVTEIYAERDKELAARAIQNLG